MNRRHFLTLSASTVLLSRCTTPSSTGPTILTVKGPVLASELGTVLSHEHAMVDFAGADVVSPDRYNPTEVFNTVLPYLREIKQSGCDSFFDFTPDYLGRDPEILLRLSNASGLNIITNTGYYGARDDVHLPPYVMTESADELAARWIAEYEDGIGDTGIKPGFLKIGVDIGPLSEVDAKLVRAAARTHLVTGLTIAVHTGPSEPAVEQMDILKEEGVGLSAWIWVHAQAEQDRSRHLEAAQQGAWVAFDGVNPRQLTMYIELLQMMKDNDVLNRVLISQDAGWYSVGEEGGGGFRGYAYLLDEFVPAMMEAGFSEEDVHQLLVKNPAEAFAVGVRRKGT